MFGSCFRTDASSHSWFRFFSSFPGGQESLSGAAGWLAVNRLKEKGKSQLGFGPVFSEPSYCLQEQWSQSLSTFGWHSVSVWNTIPHREAVLFPVSHWLCWTFRRSVCQVVICSRNCCCQFFTASLDDFWCTMSLNRGRNYQFRRDWCGHKEFVSVSQ